jgi:hypothetical protein
MATRTLRFTEPTMVYEGLQLADRQTPVEDIPRRIRQTIQELEVVGLVAQESVRSGRGRRVPQLCLTQDGRRRLLTARRAMLDAASAPVMVN